MSWKNKLPSTFGAADYKFAGHHLEVHRAVDLVKECYDDNVSLKEVLKEAKTYLTSKGCTSQHINEQLGSIEEKFGGWLH